MPYKMQFRRGAKADLPELDNGEPGFTEDTEELFVGTPNGNKQLTFPFEARQTLEQHTQDIEQVSAQLAQTETDLEQRAYNIKSFGVKGDGETNDSVAFQSAIDFVSSNGGGVLFIPKGVYLLNNVYLKDNVVIEGTGDSSVLKLAVEPADFMNILRAGYVGRTCKNATVKNLKFDGKYTGIYDEAKQQSHAFFIMGNTGKITVENCVFVNTAGDGICITQDGKTTESDYPKNITITKNIFESCKRNDVAVVHGFDIIISDNHCFGALDIEPEPPVGYCQRVIVKGNTCKVLNVTNRNYNRSQFVIQGNITFGNCTIWDLGGCSFTGNTIYGLLKLQGIKDVTVEGNTLKALGISPASSTAWNERVIVNGNTIINENNGDADTQLSHSNNSTIYIWRTKQLLLSNNIIISPIMSGIYIAANCEDLKIESNRLVDTDATSTTNYGIYQTSSSVNKSINIKANEIKGFYTGFRSDGASRTHKTVLAENEFESRNLNIFATLIDDLVVRGNVLYGDIGNRIYTSARPVVKENILRTTANKSRQFEFTSCDGVIFKDNDILFGGLNETVLFYNCPNTYLRERFSHATGATFTGTTTVKAGSLFYTGESTRLGAVYNGTEWIDLAF